MALISTFIRRGDFAGALTALDRLDKKQPDKPMPSDLRGKVLLLKGDFAGARRSFERAVALDPLYFPAIENLSALDVRDNRPDVAEKRFEKLLKLQPESAPALVAIAQLRARAGKSKEDVLGLLQRAVKASPLEPAPRLLLIDYQLQQKDFKEALQSAQDSLVAFPDNVEILALLARAQLLSGDFNQAITSLARIASLRPGAPQPHLALADAYATSGQKDAASQSLKRALAIDPLFLPAQHQLMKMELASGRSNEARAIARKVQAQRPSEAVGFLYEGDVEAVGQNWVRAIAAYRTALQRQPSSTAAQKLHATLLASGKRGDADSFAAQWVKEHPKDADFLFYRGNTSVAIRNYGAAEADFLSVTKLQPGNAAALNNLAWAMTKLDKKGASSYAERANQLEPNRATYLDTWATALAQENQLDKAIEVQRKAMSLQADNPGFQLALAKLYLKAGNKAAAREELEQLARLGEKFRAHEEVKRLREQL
jgi:putative PEP-CTERM system TPR-repeat lipoprotein